MSIEQVVAAVERGVAFLFILAWPSGSHVLFQFMEALESMKGYES